jgi:acetyl-CoA synthetase
MSDKAIADLQASSIDSILQEQRSFPPPPEFSQHAHIKSLEEYERLYKESMDDPEKFWSRIASELHWFKKWDKVLEWNLPWAKWFVGGQINLSYNCLDRHVQTARKNKAAIIWESEPGEIRTYTYQQLHREVQKFANVLKALGVKKNERVA